MELDGAMCLIVHIVNRRMLMIAVMVAAKQIILVRSA